MPSLSRWFLSRVNIWQIQKINTGVLNTAYARQGINRRRYHREQLRTLKYTVLYLLDKITKVFDIFLCEK